MIYLYKKGFMNPIDYDKNNMFEEINYRIVTVFLLLKVLLLPICGTGKPQPHF